MIKIERSTAVNPTILRNSTRQPVTLNMTVTQAELDSLEADSGTITYSVDEMEVRTVDFQPSKQAATAPTVDTALVAAAVPAAKIAKSVVQPARKTARATQA
jgi:hypothetical protein